MLSPDSLNDAASALADGCERDRDRLRIDVRTVGGARVIDFGVDVPGSLEAGLRLARICLAGLGSVKLAPGHLDGDWPAITVRTDWPFASCLASQYAGWQIAVGKYFAMGSGPMRAVVGSEPLFREFDFREAAEYAVGVLEARKLPNPSAVDWIVERLGLPPERLTLCVAPTASLAGTIQIVARSVETCLHKLHEVGFDVRRVRGAFGSAPLPPVAGDDLTAIGRTNDAILYGGDVILWVDCPDEEIETIGPRVPSCSSPSYGKSFRTLFDEAKGDFYKIDPAIFSPARVAFQNLSSGRTRRFGALAPEIVRRSFAPETAD